MQVALSINAQSSAEARDFMLRAAHIVPTHGMVHVDICDGLYAPYHTFADAGAWRALAWKGIKAEVHLMARDWEVRLVPWLETGMMRVIVPAGMADAEDLRRAGDVAARYGAELMPSFSLTDGITDFLPYAASAAFQILAVPAGRSGQLFDESALQKIKSLRALFPNAILEVDGGVTPVVAAQAKDAGADIVVSSSYIWNAENPKEAYEKLLQI